MLIDFHPSAGAAFDGLSDVDQRDVDKAIEDIYQDFRVGEFLRGGPCRQYDFGQVRVVYYIPEPYEHLIICYVQGSS